jgi:hypothetical protein
VKHTGYAEAAEPVFGKAHFLADGTSDLGYPPLMINGIWIPGRNRGLHDLNQGFHDLSFPNGLSPHQPAGRQERRPGSVRVFIDYKGSLCLTIRVSLIFFVVIPYFSGQGGRQEKRMGEIAIHCRWPEAWG